MSTKGEREQQIPLALRRVSLPKHPILYTLDQVAVILSVSVQWVKNRTMFTGREAGTRNKLHAINIAEPTETAEWRISERELKVWLARHGYRITED